MNWTSYGAWGAGGLLVGIVVATAMDPMTTNGFLVIVMVCLLAAIVLRGMANFLQGK